MRQLHRIDQIGLQRGDLVVVVSGANFDTGGLQPHDIFAEPLLGADRSGLPAAGLQDREPARLFAGRHLVRALQPGSTGIAANPRDDFTGDLPGIRKRRGQDPGAALALIIVAAFAIDRVDTGLEADAAAKARWAKHGADDLRAECGADRAYGNGGSRAARRAARRVRRVPRIAGAARL